MSKRKAQDRPDPEALAALGKSDEAFEQAYQAAIAKGQTEMPDELEAVRVGYDVQSDRIGIDLANQSTFLFPVRHIEAIAGLSPDELANVEITPDGYGLRWDVQDIELYLPDILRGIFGTRKWMVKLAAGIAGSHTSPAKAASSRENGKKGGRPRKAKQAS